MRPSRQLWKRSAALAGCVILATGPAVLGNQIGSPLGITGYSVTGDVVQVEIFNAGDTTLTGTLHAHVRLADRDASVWTTVRIDGARKAFVDLQMPSEVVEVITLGVVLDDGCPF